MLARYSMASMVCPRRPMKIPISSPLTSAINSSAFSVMWMSPGSPRSLSIRDRNERSLAASGLSSSSESGVQSLRRRRYSSSYSSSASSSVSWRSNSGGMESSSGP